MYSGPVVPVTDVRIVDPITRKELPEGKVGLLLVRGPQVMKRYYGNDGELITLIEIERGILMDICRSYSSYD